MNFFYFFLYLIGPPSGLSITREESWVQRKSIWEINTQSRIGFMIDLEPFTNRRRAQGWRLNFLGIKKADFSREPGYDGTHITLISLGYRFSHDPMVAV